MSKKIMCDYSTCIDKAQVELEIIERYFVDVNTPLFIMTLNYCKKHALSVLQHHIEYALGWKTKEIKIRKVKA